MSFLKGLMKFAPAALTLGSAFFPPLAAAGPLAQGALGAGAAGLAAAGNAGAPGAAPPDMPPPITSEAPMDAGQPPPRPVPGAVAGPQPGAPDLNNFDYRSVLAGAKPGANTGSRLPGMAGGLLAGGLLPWALKKFAG